MKGAQDIIQIGDIILIHGDMREVLPGLDAPADMVLSDPPYRLTSGGNSTGEMGGCFAHGRYDNSGALFGMVEWAEMAPLIYRAAAPQADAVIMTSDREYLAGRAAFEAAGWGFHRTLVWDKVTATPNRWYMPNCEFAIYLYKGAARRIRDCGSKALIRCPQRDETLHPTEKPVALMAHWLTNSTDPGDLVLDPFMGTGTTLVAAAQTGRRAIGIELDRQWFDVAVARVQAATRQAEMAV